MLNLNDMAVFAAVAKAGSFVGAAERLQIPKSTVSHKVAQLEEQLGVRLLQRSTRKIKLTERGSVYLTYCEKMVAAADEADAAIKDIQQEPRGTLRVSSAPGFMPNFLLEIYEEFLRTYPGLNIEVVTSAKYLDLIEEGIDLALRIGPLPESSLIARHVCSISRYLVASPAYIDNYGEPKNIDDLNNHRCITYDLSTAWNFTKANDVTSYVPTSRIVSNDIQTIKAMAIGGLGVAVLPDIWIAEALKSGQLLRLLPKVQLNGRTLNIVYPSRKQLNPNVVRLTQYVIDRCYPKPPWHIA